MTTETAAHGERRCYLRGCRRAECSQANYRYMSRLRLDRARGNNRRTPSKEAAQHVDRLVEAGWNHTQIAREAGVGRRTINTLAARHYPNTNRDIARAVLALEIVAPPNDQQDTDATGTVRRIRALIAIGHTGTFIANTVGLHRDALNKITRHEQPRVRTTTARSIATAYRRLALTPGPSVRARTDAARKGWHGPLAWDETTIDNPEAEPETDTGTDDLPRNELAAVRRAEVEHLNAFNLPEDDIARRLGMAKSTVHTIVTELRSGQRRDRSPAAA